MIRLSLPFLLFFLLSATPCFAEEEQEQELQIPELISFEAAFPQFDRLNSGSLIMLAQQGAASIHLPLSMTKDGQIILAKATTLDESYPALDQDYSDRRRDDGLYYFVDFDLFELQEIAEKAGQFLPFLTLERAFAVGRALHDTSGLVFSYYLEYNDLAFHHKLNLDPVQAVLNAIKSADKAQLKEPVYILSNQADQLEILSADQRITEGSVQIQLSLIIKEPSPASAAAPDYNWLFTHLGLRSISYFVKSLFISTNISDSLMTAEQLQLFVENTHKYGLKVFFHIPAPVREENNMEPAESFTDFSKIDNLLYTLKGDGLLTEYNAGLKNHLEQVAEDERSIAEKEKNSVQALLPHLFKNDNETTTP